MKQTGYQLGISVAGFIPLGDHHEHVGHQAASELDSLLPILNGRRTSHITVCRSAQQLWLASRVAQPRLYANLEEATDAITLGRRHSWLESEGFHYPLPTLMSRNFRLPRTIELQPLSLTPLKMRKVEPAIQV